MLTSNMILSTTSYEYIAVCGHKVAAVVQLKQVLSNEDNDNPDHKQEKVLHIIKPNYSM